MKRRGYSRTANGEKGGGSGSWGGGQGKYYQEEGGGGQDPLACGQKTLYSGGNTTHQIPQHEERNILIHVEEKRGGENRGL